MESRKQTKNTVGWIVVMTISVIGILTGLSGMIVGASIQTDPFANEPGHFWKQNFWTVIPILLYGFVPIPVIVGLALKGRIVPEDSEGNVLTSVYSHYGMFGAAFLFVLALGVMITLSPLRAHIIGWFCFFLNNMGLGVIIVTLVLTFIVYKCFFIRKREHDELL